MAELKKQAHYHVSEAEETKVYHSSTLAPTEPQIYAKGFADGRKQGFQEAMNGHRRVTPHRECTFHFPADVSTDWLSK